MEMQLFLAKLSFTDESCVHTCKQCECTYPKLEELHGAGLLPPHTLTYTARPAAGCRTGLAQLFPFNFSGTIKAAQPQMWLQ